MSSPSAQNNQPSQLSGRRVAINPPTIENDNTTSASVVVPKTPDSIEAVPGMGPPLLVVKVTATTSKLIASPSEPHASTRTVRALMGRPLRGGGDRRRPSRRRAP